jgi:hypothetical protein
VWSRRGVFPGSGSWSVGVVSWRGVRGVRRGAGAVITSWIDGDNVWRDEVDADADDTCANGNTVSSK